MAGTGGRYFLKLNIKEVYEQGEGEAIILSSWTNLVEVDFILLEMTFKVRGQ